MESIDDAVDGIVPSGLERQLLDVRELPPPQPLQQTLEVLAELDSGVALVQLNDRVPQFLFPKLEDRGYAFETVEREKVTITAIWQA